MTEARRTGPALERMYRFLLWLVPAVEKFPRRQKFLLGDRNRRRQCLSDSFLPVSFDNTCGVNFPPFFPCSFSVNYI